VIIRKLFKIENAHIVRGCSSERCRSSVHGHSYTIELLFESNYLDNGQMVYDFGLMKQNIKDILDSFDHAITLWSGDDINYIDDMKKHSSRWIELPVSPSAEQFARVFYIVVDKLFHLTNSINGEKEVKLNSVIVHETATGYAQAFNEDAYSTLMGDIKLEEIVFSNAIQEDWKVTSLFEDIKNSKTFNNPSSV